MNRPSGPSRQELRAIARRAMVERGLEPDFPPDAVSETNALTRAATDASPSVRDERRLLWASIDNDDSRDLDQLSVAQPLGGGAVKILVAIADVDASVAKGSALDRHAGTNTTSVYTAAGTFPMLPEKLSTDLTSLGQGAERLAVVVEMTVGADGAVTASEVYRAAVVNQAKLAYDAVAAWLGGTAPPPARVAGVPRLDEQLQMQDAVAQRMKRLRAQHGALELESGEARAVFDDGALTALRRDDRNRAKGLIEEFMIAANGVVARYLAAKGIASLRRVLRVPERWPRIVELAAALGEALPAAPSAVALREFLAHRHRSDPARFPDLSLSIIKLLGAGEYALERPGDEPAGHFGLAVQDYTHSTAPNRRLPDLVTQRLLKAALAGDAVPYANDELAALARHCTEQEGNAAKVERQVLKSAAAQLLAARIGERFDAVVTGAAAKGTWVRIVEPPVEGKLVRGFERLDVGDRLRVELTHVDVARGFIDFVRSGDGA